MSRGRATIALVLLGISACAQGYQSGLAANDATSREIFFGTNSASAAIGIPPLRDTPLPEGTQEIRIWSDGIGVGAQSDLIRLTRSSHDVNGSFSAFWSIEQLTAEQATRVIATDSITRHAVAGRCGEFTRANGDEACRFRLLSQPDWRALWDSLGRLGIWTLADESSLPRDGIGVMDGWGMSVELRDGPRYRAYYYSNPDRHAGAPYASATAINSAVAALWRRVAPASNERIVPGKLDVIDRSLFFTPCGTTDSLVTYLNSTMDTAGLGFIRSGTTTGASRYAVFQSLAQLPRVKNTRPPDRPFVVDSVLLLRPWAPNSCEQEPAPKPE